MKRIRCLALAGVFPPAGGAGALRLLKLLKYLPAHGVDTHVIAPRGAAGFFVDAALEKQLESLRVTRVGLAPTAGLRSSVKARVRLRSGLAPLRKLAFPDEYALWAARALIEARQHIVAGEVDVLLTASFPYSAHLAGLALTRLHGIPWVADFADPWAGHWFRGLDTGRRAKAHVWLEAQVAHAARGVSVASPGMQRRFREKYPRADIRVVTNAFDPEDARSRSAPAGATLVLLFLGTFDARLTPPDPWLAALTAFVERHPELAGRLVLRVIGGADAESERRIAAWQRTSPAAALLERRGFLPHHEALRALDAASALVLSVAPGADWHLTAKVIEYAASTRPIVAVAPEGDCRDFLKAVGGSVVVDPDDPEALVGHLASAVRADGFHLGERDRGALEAYAAPTIAGRFAAWLQELASA